MYCLFVSLLFTYIRDVGSKRVANMVRGKTVKEIRAVFGIVNDFLPEEEVRPQLLSRNGPRLNDSRVSILLVGLLLKGCITHRT